MKNKLFILMMACGMLVACTSKESLLSDYEKACKKGDAAKAEKIAIKLDEKYGSELTTQDQIRITNASLMLFEDAMKSSKEILQAGKDIMDEMEDWE